NDRLASSRRMLWSARAIRQAASATLSISLQPFVTSLAADTEPATQLTEIASWLLPQGHKLLSQRHGRTLLPRHASLLKRFSCHCLMCYPCLWTPVTHVSGLYRERAGVRAWRQDPKYFFLRFYRSGKEKGWRRVSFLLIATPSPQPSPNGRGSLPTNSWHHEWVTRS